MAGVLSALAEIDLSRLEARLALADGTVSVEATASLAGFDPRSLLGDLGAIVAAAGELPTDPREIVAAVTAGLDELADLVRLPAVESMAEAAEVFADLAGRLGVLAEPFAGGAEALVETLLEPFNGLEALVQDLAARFAEAAPLAIPDALRLPLEAVQQLSGAAPANAADLGALLSRFLTGLDPATLAAPAQLLDQIVARVGASGGDFAPAAAEAAALAVQVRAIAQSLAAPEVDVPAVAAALAPVRVGVDQLLDVTLPAAQARLLADLAALPAADLGVRLGELLDPFLAVMPEVDLQLDDQLVESLQGLAAQIEELTAESVAALFADVEAQLRERLETSDLAELPRAIDDVFDAAIEQIRRVPLARLRDDLLDALVGLDARIRDFAGFAPAFLLADRLAGVEQAITSVDTAAVTARIQELQTTIEGAVAGLPIEEIKTELEGVTGAVAAAIAEFTPAVQELAARLDGLAAEVEAIDLEAAGAASIDLMAEIRANVQAVAGSPDLPAPAKLAVAAAAQGLKQIDFSVQVSAPFDAIVAELDPQAALAPLAEGFATVRGVVESVTPQALVDRLEQPYLRLLGSLARFRPDALLGDLSQELTRFADLIAVLDPRTLVAPLEARFQEVVAELRQAADPAPLFAPLKEAHAGLLGLLDPLDFDAVFGALLGRVATLPELMTNATSEALAAKTGAVPAPPPLAEAPFRFGDVLRPLAALVAQVRRAVLALSEAMIGEALDLLTVPIAALRRLVDPVEGPGAAVARAVEEQRAQLDPFAPTGVAADLRAALDELSLAAAGASLSVDARAELDGAVASVRFEARVTGLTEARAAFEAQAAAVRARLVPPDLALALDRLGRVLDDLIPAPLLAPAAGAAVSARIAALFDAVDPARLVTELDAIGDRIQAKLTALGTEIARGLFVVWNAQFDLFAPVMPAALLARLNAGLGRVRAELTVLDPAPIEAEVRDLLVAVTDTLSAFSPAALAAELGTLFDAVRDRLADFDPAALLGDLDPVGAAVDRFEELRPSIVLAPLIEETGELHEALEKLTSVQLGEALLNAIVELRASLEAVVAGLRSELDGLLDDLGAIDGEVSVAVAVG